MLSNAPIFPTIPCADLAGARAFYGQTLGLNEKQVYEEGGKPSGVFYQCGQETMLLVYSRPTPTKADHTAASWMVEDIDSAVANLLDQGVKFLVYDMPGVEWDERGVASMGDFKTAWFTDPEGNILSIVQMP